MIKTEQLRSVNQSQQLLSNTVILSPPSRLPMFQTTPNITPHRAIDPHAIDISSIKGRFAWEKIVLGDTYMPVIFRGTIKYFCVKMLHKLLPEYPEDVFRRSSYYQYRKPMDLYVATPNELRLLNKINSHHAHWAYSRQPLTAIDELVRVADFLPFYEHLQLVHKSTHNARSGSTGSLRQILPQPQQSVGLTPDFVINMSIAGRENSNVLQTTIPIQMSPCSTSQSSRPSTSLDPPPVIPVPPALRPSRPPKHGTQPSVPSRTLAQYPSTQLQQRLPSPSTQQPKATSSSNIINSTNTVSLEYPRIASVTTSAFQPTKAKTSILQACSSSPDPVVSLSTTKPNRKRAGTASESQLSLLSKQSSSSPSSSLLTTIAPTPTTIAPTTITTPTSIPSPSVSKPTRLNSGWLQVNKLYTPYVSLSTSNHHLYKIPVSLLTFYDLLKTPLGENNINESKDGSLSFGQTRVTSQEIELINELCLKQNIKPFTNDTKLISLLTFYQYCSANILFVKELPLNEPKASICKDWSSVVQINGGICRLRNITTLHEQTVPFIGNNLLKNFIISSQCLASASLTTPTSAEMEFLQLILFLSNMSINIRNAKLIDIESVQKEYNVDLILLFNDKFPLNVLNYQHQDNRPSTSQGQTMQSNSSAATNTFAESTPPPSPPSPPRNNNPINPAAQLPLTSSSFSSSSASISSDRYQKTITFHGHSMIAYICSGLGSNAQRECVSVKALCNMLYPNSSILDKLETRMLRLLRLKNINRFRPQNQQSMGFTRLIDVQDAAKHWTYIEQGMGSLLQNGADAIVLRGATSSLLDKDLKASTSDKIEKNSEKIEQITSIEVDDIEKRSLESEFEEDVPVVKRMDKRIRISIEDGNEQSKLTQSQSIKTINNKCDDRDDDDNKTRKDNNDNEDKNRRMARPPIRIVHKQTDKQNINNKIPQQIDRISNKSSMSLQKTSVPIKKKIKIIRKRPTPYKRSNKQSIAAWVQKYNIEECCIRLDLYHRSTETRKDSFH